MTNEELELLCHERKNVTELRDMADGAVKELSGKIRAELESRGVSRVELTDFVPAIVTQTRHTLDKVKLVELGVPVATIEAATSESTTSFVRVDTRKAGAGAAAKPTLVKKAKEKGEAA